MEEHTQELTAAHREGRIERRDFLRRSAVLGLSAPFLDAALVHAARPAIRRGGTIKVVGAAPASIEPPLLADPSGTAVVQLVGEYLVTVDANLMLQPRLATSWRAGEDGESWTFHLRRGVRFNDGRLMTADDVVATFRRLVNPKTNSPAADSLTFLRPEGVRKVDQFTVAFDLTRAVADFPYYLNSTSQAVILPADWPGQFARNPIGTGPFLLKEYVPQQRATYIRNPTYWNAGLPYLDGAEIMLGLSDAAQVQALLSGNADIMIATPVHSLPALAGHSGVKVLKTRSSYYDGIFMRYNQEPFKDKRVRQAMALALDRPAIVRSLLHGQGVVGDDHAVAPVYPVYSPIPQREQNYAEARRLLAAAGHARGFSMTLVTSADTPDLVPLATAAGQMWRPLGIDVTIRSEPASVYYNTDWLQSTLTATDWSHRPTPGQVLRIGYSTHGAWNASHWSNPRFDSLVKQLDATLDFSARKMITRQIELLMYDDVPAIIPYFVDALRAVRSHAEGIVADAGGSLDLSRAYVSS